MINQAAQARVFGRAVPAVVLLALFLRWPMPWPTWTHFDETAFIVLPLGFWGGDFNPHYFNYPTFHFYLTSLTYGLAWLVGWGTAASESAATFVAWQYLIDGRDVLAVARWQNALLSTATVGIVALLGRRLYGPVAGLLAAASLAVMPLATRFAPLANTDTPALFWSALALLGACHARQTGTKGAIVLAGIAAGLAAATKYPAVVIAVPVAAALIHGPIQASARRVAICAAACLVSFCLATPYVLLDAATFWHHFADMAGTHLVGDNQAQDGNLIPRAVRYAVGLVGLPTLAVGLLLALRERGWQDLVVLTTALIIVLLLLPAHSSFLRYALPLALPLALWVGRGLAAIRQPIPLVLVAAVCLSQPLLASLYTRSMLSGPDTRGLAQAWLAANAPHGTWLREPDSPCGRLDLLRPQDLFVRQAHFLRSYGIDGAYRAYTTLAARTDLPPLFPPGNGRQGLRLDYLHPLCGSDGSAAGTQGTSALKIFAAGTPKTGELEVGDFDRQDWYFVPLRAVGLGVSGPTVLVHAAGTDTSMQNHNIDTSEFLLAMGWIMQASMAMDQGDSMRARELYNQVLAAWPAPSSVFGEQVAAGIHRQLARIQRQK